MIDLTAPPSGSSVAKCKGDKNCAPMNKWFWIEGDSDNPVLGKKGETIDPKRRKYIALNSKLIALIVATVQIILFIGK